MPCPDTMTPDASGDRTDMDLLEKPSESGEEPTTCPSASPTARRKSWRRATITRRSLPSLPNPYQSLCKSISTSLSPQERLSLLMEAAMKLAIERLENSLTSVPNSSPTEVFQKQVENLQTEWHSLSKSIRSEQQTHPDSEARCDDFATRTALDKIQNTINRLKAEHESWGALLQKHQRRAEELKISMCHRKVSQKAVALDQTCLAQSSQYQFIQNKPDYHGLLSRQQPMMHTMAAIMDTQCQIVRELQSIKEQSQLMVKETSGRLAAQAGFRDYSTDVIKELVMAPFPYTTTLNGGKLSN
ncbi:kinetochore-associated protein DSN1 homolog isoform X3 [Entelurus aequoreus]|nr:kinetochore-associated protein DSN1 homolog isoform X3 [Entelurus aequoreus]